MTCQILAVLFLHVAYKSHPIISWTVSHWITKYPQHTDGQSFARGQKNQVSYSRILSRSLMSPRSKFLYNLFVILLSKQTNTGLSNQNIFLVRIIPLWHNYRLKSIERRRVEGLSEKEIKYLQELCLLNWRIVFCYNILCSVQKSEKLQLCLRHSPRECRQGWSCSNSCGPSESLENYTKLPDAYICQFVYSAPLPPFTLRA